MLYAEKGRQILLQNDVWCWRASTSLLIMVLNQDTMFSVPVGGGCNWRSGMVVPDMHEI